MKRLLTFLDSRCACLWSRARRSTEVAPRRLALARIAIGLYFLALGIPRFSWIASAPDALFDPPYFSIANLFEGFPPHWVFAIGDLVYPLLLLCLVLGIRSRWAGVALLLLHVALSSFRYSFGKIDHDLMVYLSVGVLSLSNWGTCFAIWPDKPVSEERHRFALALLGTCLAFAMLSAGVEKAWVWIDFDLQTSGFLSWYQSGYYSLDRQYFLAPYLQGFAPLVYELFDYSAVAFELSGFALLLAGKRAWQAWLTVACVFHTGNLLFLNISFTAHVFVYGIYLLPLILTRFCVLDRLEQLGGRWRTLLVWTPVAMTLSHLYQRTWADEGYYLFFISDPETAGFISRYIPLLLWLSLATFSAISLTWAIRSEPSADARARTEASEARPAT